MDRRTVMTGAVGLGLAAPSLAQRGGAMAWPPAESFPLWPGRPPGSPARLPPDARAIEGPPQRRELHLRGVAEPRVGVYRPARPDGRAVLVLAGGGYGYVSIENEGLDVARALTPHGITVFVLAYRLPGEGWARGWDVPLQDAQRALRLIRARAGQWRIDPASIGTLGFSAGGHLAASLAVGHDDPVYNAVDASDRESARPAYAGLIYAIARGAPGGGAPAAEARRYETDRRIARTTPPLFLLHAFDDPVVPITAAIQFLNAARSAGVGCEVHLLERGGHGFGARNLDPALPGRDWPAWFARWSAAHSG